MLWPQAFGGEVRALESPSRVGPSGLLHLLLENGAPHRDHGMGRPLPSGQKTSSLVAVTAGLSSRSWASVGEVTICRRNKTTD